jgi:hypothetical protein
MVITDKTTVEKELAFLRKFVRDFEQLDAATQTRVWLWIEDRYGPPTTGAAAVPYPPAGVGG